MKKQIMNWVPDRKKYIIIIAAPCAERKWTWALSSRDCGHVLSLTFHFSEIRMKEVVYSWFTIRILQILPPERLPGSLTTLNLCFRDTFVPWDLFVLWVMGSVCDWKVESWFTLCCSVYMCNPISEGWPCYRLLSFSPRNSTKMAWGEKTCYLNKLREFWKM